MAELKSARHHWWPVSVSKRWADEEGQVNRLCPNGEFTRSKPKNFGAIRNGHQIKLGQEPDEFSPWDQDFEAEFSLADDNFPWLIDWLQSLRHTPARERIGRFSAYDVSDKQASDLIQSLVSLAVRSPMNRESSVSLAEEFRGPLPERERNAIIGLNMRNMQREAVARIGGRGKLVVLYSPEKELIFGDGFYHNIAGPHVPSSPKILAPLTPDMAVLFVRPTRYSTEPRLMSIVLEPGETDFMNRTIQIYARDEIFFRSELPILTQDYECGKHRRFDGWDNPVEKFIRSIPGVGETANDLWTSLQAIRGR